MKNITSLTIILQVSKIIPNFVLSTKRQYMPELFRQYGFVFLFFSHEHEPIHVHVRGHNGNAKYVWDGEGFALEHTQGIKSNDLKRIERTIHENADIILNRWYEIFGHTDEDDE